MVSASCGLSLLAGSAQAAPPELAPKPAGIVNGTDVGECGYAAVGSYGHTEGEERVACSLTLIAPDVVLTAAHCLDATGTPPEVRFGETFLDAPRSVPVDFCMAHPGWDGDWGDIGFCVLAEPVLDIPIIPMATGCELEDAVPGAEIEVVGFGVSSAVYDPNLPPEFPYDTEGAGIKRKTPQTLEALVMPSSQIWMLGDPQLNNSSCFGDSGGPVVLHLADGQARVLGVGQMIHPDNPNFDEPCGYGIIYQAAWPHLSWLESMSGRDLTPCWTGGTWDPGPGCGGFALNPELEVGTWGEGCVGGGSISPAGPTCEADPGGTTTTTTEGGETTTTTEGGETTTTEGGDTTTTGGGTTTSGETTTTTGDDEVGGDESAGTGSDPGQWVPDSSGCGCAAGEPDSSRPGRGWSGLGVLLVLGAAASRRQRRSLRAS